MGKVRVEIKTSFGKLVVEGSTASELLETLRALPKNFLDDVEAVSNSMLSLKKRELSGVVEQTAEGPVLISRARLTHYEAIGLTLYFSNDGKNTASQISRLLEYSGMRLQVSSRLNEMAKKGLIFKPDPVGPEWALSREGERWIEEKVLARLKP